MAQVNTVLGPIPPEGMGITATHEYVLFGLPGCEHDPEDLLNRAQTFEKVSADLKDFKSLGGSTLVDCSGIAAGRYVEFLQALSQSTGVQIVASTGFWDELATPGHFWYDRGRDEDYLARIFVNELTLGMVTRSMIRTSTKAGLIHVGNSPDQITRQEELNYRAAGRAAKRTGCAVTTCGGRTAMRQLELLMGEGASASRILVGHCDNPAAQDLERDKEIARRGAYVGYDHIGTETGPQGMPDQGRVELVKAMIEAGFVTRVILSCGAIGHAMGWPQTAQSYAHLLRSFVPKLRQAGVSDDAIQTMLVENPKRLLAF